MDQDKSPEAEASAELWDWGVVEIMGHRTHAGRFREEERFGAKFIRIDVPVDGDPAKGWITHLYGAAAIFSLRLSDEASVMKANRPYVSPYRLTLANRADAIITQADAAGDFGDTDYGEDEP
jgi:hypothetical protein